MTSICASCTSFSLDSPMLSSSKKKPQWLDEHDFVTEFIKSVKDIQSRKPSYCDQKVDINMGKKAANKIVLYWAADANDSLIVQGARKAYGKFKNHGIIQLNEQGSGVVY